MRLFEVIYCEMLSHAFTQYFGHNSTFSWIQFPQGDARAVNLTITHVLHAIGLGKSLHVSALSWEKKEEGEVEVSSTSEVP